jgi:hypothetical protein
VPLITNKYINLRCKICDGKTHVSGFCDFNKSCEEEKGIKVFPYTGHAICYHACDDCGFIFTVDFDDWEIKDFVEHIYNSDYAKVDPDYLGKRALESANWLISHFGEDKSKTFLDYGAGDNKFSEELVKQGFDSVGWDPMWQHKPKFKKNSKFDVVTAFEVLEHTPTPTETLNDIVNFVKPDSGAIIFSTLISRGTKHEYWYVAPRNGHVCMHSLKSLQIMFGSVNMEVKNLNASHHVATWKKIKS